MAESLNEIFGKKSKFELSTSEKKSSYRKKEPGAFPGNENLRVLIRILILELVFEYYFRNV